MKLGFFGAGNMGFALMNGMTKMEMELGAFDVDIKARKKAEGIGAKGFDNAKSLLEWADMLVCCVKPQYFADLHEMLGGSANGKPIVSIVAGFSTDKLRNHFPGSRVLRIMPNTPSLVGQGMSALSLDTDFLDDEKVLIEQAFGCVGKVAWVQEVQMDAVTGVSGSGPAYVYLMIEALTEAGVREGLAFQVSQQLAAQTVLGAAEMVLRSETHPAQLRAQVTSPGGTTAEALYQLEKAGFKAAVLDAVRASAQKSRAIGGKQ